MTNPFTDANPFLDMLRKFGADLQVPQFDLDHMIEAHRSNVEAQTSSASTMADGAQAMARKQREIVEAGLRKRPRGPRRSRNGVVRILRGTRSSPKRYLPSQSRARRTRRN